jgi:twitching motility protein PilT
MGEEKMISDLKNLLKTMVKNKASDLHIRSGGPAFVRIVGNIKPVEKSEMTAEQVSTLAYSCMNEKAKKDFENKHEADFSIDDKEYGRFRLNVFQQRGRICVSARHIPADIPGFEDLNLPSDTLKKISENPRGLVLGTGVTGAGKSSTLAAMIDYVNRLYPRHIITIEDPIEFLHKDKRSIISQREVGIDSESFLTALRAALRQDPDVILLGEMRDHETAKAAITAAETGHLVLATVHTINAVQTISRIIDIFPPHQQNQIRMQLAETLKAVISQRLLNTTGGSRRPAVEILIVTPNVKKLILENNLSDITKAIEKGAYYGMQTFNQSLIGLYKKKLVDLEEVLQAASNPDDVMLAIRGIEQDVKVDK